MKAVYQLLHDDDEMLALAPPPLSWQHVTHSHTCGGMYVFCMPFDIMRLIINQSLCCPGWLNRSFYFLLSFILIFILLLLVFLSLGFVYKIREKNKKNSLNDEENKVFFFFEMDLLMIWVVRYWNKELHEGPIITWRYRFVADGPS